MSNGFLPRSKRNRLIGKLYNEGYSQVELAEWFKLSRQRIGQIVHFKRHNARGYIDSLMRSGKMPPARDLKCKDCGKPADYYDHYLGYEFENRGKVEPVCKECDGIRYSERGEVRKGENHWAAKLTKTDVIEMRKLRHDLGKKIRFKELGEMFGITESAAHNAIKGIIWNHIPNYLN